MTRANIVTLGFLCFLLGACTQRMICPAYQSAYIYDKDELRKKFSYFLGDSTPKVYAASKTRYLVAEPMSYQKRLRSLQTVRMKPVPVVVPDSLLNNKDSVTMDELNRAARSVIDSTVVVDVPKKDSAAIAPLDSIYVITKDKELRLLKYNGSDSLDYDSATQRYVVQRPKYYVADVRYNMEQDNYMWYLRDVIVLPDARIAKMGGGEAKGEDGKPTEKKKQGLKGFFKNLFKKKPREEADTTDNLAPPKEEFDFIDEADSTSKAEVPLPGQEDTAPVKPNKKATKASRKKNKKSPVIEPKPEEKKPADKKKEEDDGF
jgi:hypothetical protein